MLLSEAQRALQRLLAPLTLDEFLDRTLGGGLYKLDGAGSAERMALLGPDPRAILGAAFQLAPKLTFHSANPLGSAPSLEGVADADDFRARIAQFHARNYSVRFPELRPLWPQLDRLARALEVLLYQPVTTSAFWSMGGMRAPVHYDDHDLIVVQLLGEKRWHVADASEHQGVEIVAFHAGEDFCAPFGTQEAKVNAGIVFEAHHPDEHTAIAGRGAHAAKP